MTFKEFYLNERVELPLIEKIKTFASSDRLVEVINRYAGSNIDEAIENLKRSKPVKKVLEKWDSLSNQNEGIVSSAVGWVIESIVKTIKHVLGGFFFKASPTSKLNYFAALLLTFGLSGTLLAVGAPASVVTGSLPFTATAWALMWFGKNVIQPYVYQSEGIPVD